MAGNNNNGRVLTKDLDTRLKSVEDRLSELAKTLKRIEDQAHQAMAEAQAAANRSTEAAAAADRLAEAQAEAAHHAGSNGDGNGNGAEPDDKLSRLEAVVGRLDDRVEKITQTLIQQAHRFS